MRVRSNSATSQQQPVVAAEQTISSSSHHQQPSSRRHRKSLSLRRKKKKMDDSSSSLSHDESTTDLSFSTNASTTSQKSRRRRLRRLVQALSFEGRRSRHNKSSKGNNGRPKDIHVIVEDKPLALESRTTEEKQGDGHSQQQQQNQLDSSANTTRTVVDSTSLQMASGTIVATLEATEQGDEEIFYDAQAEGDGANEDDFAEGEGSCESILLDNVLAIQPGGAIYLKPGERIEVTLDMEKKEAEGSCLAPPPSSMTLVHKHMQSGNGPEAPPPPPRQLPLRFLRAGKGNVTEGKRRYKATLDWRRENSIDTILREPNRYFHVIKQHYPHFCHGTGFNGEPCYYEQPPRTNLKAIWQAGATLEDILRHYVQVTEFQWQYLVRDDLTRSIYIIDLKGMGIRDFVGDVVDFVKRASALSSQHYPERAGFVFVINVPAWFKMVWDVVKRWVDEATLKKIHILRTKKEIFERMSERIPAHNIPQEYGGKSPYPLGQSPEEMDLKALIEHNNCIAKGDLSCGGVEGSCKFCQWKQPRSY